MSFPKLRMTAAAITVVALGVVGVALTASSASGAPAPMSVAQSAPSPTPSFPVQPPAAAGSVSPHFQVAGRTSEMQYVPVAPCKLVDTRGAGGRFGNGTTRAFHARGTGSLAGQGGSASGCGLPTNAAAINVSVSAINPSNGGFIRLNAGDVSDPGITSVNYVKNQSITAAATVNLSAPGTANAFKVTNTGGPTDIQVAVVGYYIAPLAAEVSNNGNVILGSRETAARRLSTGAYEVDFDRDISRCYYNATAFAAGLTAEVEPRNGNTAGVFLVFAKGTAATDTVFYLTVSC